MCGTRKGLVYQPSSEFMSHLCCRWWCYTALRRGPWVKIDNDRVQSFHMQSQRRILGVKWNVKITNTAIKETTGDNRANRSTFSHHRSTPLTFWPHLPIIRRYTSFTSKALHLSIDAFTGTPPATDWKHAPGRPRRTWLQQVEEDMGLPISACQFTTLDRSLWRLLRPSACRAQQWLVGWVVFYVPANTV